MIRIDANQLSEQLAALEQQVGRIMMRGKFGKTWDAMSLTEQVDVIAYCQRVVGKPKSLTFSALRPGAGLEISQSRVWAVVIDCDSEMSAYRIGKWAISESALIAVQGDSEGYRVRCLGLNPRVWRDVLDRYAS